MSGFGSASEQVLEALLLLESFGALWGAITAILQPSCLFFFFSFFLVNQKNYAWSKPILFCTKAVPQGGILQAMCRDIYSDQQWLLIPSHRQALNSKPVSFHHLLSSCVFLCSPGHFTAWFDRAHKICRGFLGCWLLSHCYYLETRLGFLLMLIWGFLVLSCGLKSLSLLH